MGTGIISSSLPLWGTCWEHLCMSLWGQVAHGMWDLSSLARNGTHSTCSGSSESQPLDCQGRPCMLLLLSRFSRVRLCDPIDGSPSGSTVPGILQARTLEQVAISFSNAWKWKVKVKSLGRSRFLATPWTGAYQGFSRQEYWSGLLLPSPKTLYTSL